MASCKCTWGYSVVDPRMCFAGVLSEIVDRRSGQMARTPQLLDFAQHYGLRCISIADLIRYLQEQPQLLPVASQ